MSLDSFMLTWSIMAMVCTSPHTVPFSRNQTRSAPYFPSKFFLTSKLGCTSVSFAVNEERRGVMRATVRSKGSQDSVAASATRVTMAASAENSSTSKTEPRPFGVLFVCLGEIPLFDSRVSNMLVSYVGIMIKGFQNLVCEDSS